MHLQQIPFLCYQTITGHYFFNNVNYGAFFSYTRQDYPKIQPDSTTG
jgi:hypothetical protein